MKKNHNLTSSLKIIGGTLKTRNIKFTELRNNNQLRPTTARLRETLFNWLMRDIQDSFCLDMFAGSGILGFEALSRGASSILAFEVNKLAVKNININAENLNLYSASDNNLYEVKHASCFESFKNIDNIINSRNELNSNIIIFCDPPFQEDILINTLDTLINLKINNNNNKDGIQKIFLYLELPAKLTAVQTQKLQELGQNTNWKIIKDTKVADVYGRLYVLP